MLDKSVPALSGHYTTLCAVELLNDKDELVQAAIKAFFSISLQNFYTYKVALLEPSDKGDQKITVNIKQPDIGVIGTATFQFFESDSRVDKNYVKMVECSNPIICCIINNSGSRENSIQIGLDKSFLKLSNSLEQFRNAWSAKRKLLKNKSSRLEMSFFGAITETQPSSDPDDLIYDVFLILESRWRDGIKNDKEAKNLSEIINFLILCISTNKIEKADIERLRERASTLKNANANTLRKLLVGAMTISLPVFIGGVVLAIIALGPVGGAIAAVISVFLIVFLIRLVRVSAEKPDFPSKAVLYLADKIEESLPGTQVLTNVLKPEVLNSLGMPSSSVFYTVPTPDFEELFERFCKDSLEPVLKEICKENIGDDKILESLKEGLKAQYNQGKSITQLKDKIEKAVSGENQQESLDALYEACGLEKSRSQPSLL